MAENASTKKERDFRGFRGYQHYLFFSGAAGIYVIVACVILNEFFLTSMAATAAIVMMVTIIATLVHTALWSVFAPGGMIKRTLLTLACTSLVVLGLVIGVFILYSNDLEQYDYLAGKLTILLLVPMVVAAQLPLWIARGMFGLQIVYRNDTPTRMSIQELMLVTMLFGLSFALPAVANQLLLPDVDLTIGETYVSESRGSAEEVTDENIQEIRAEIIGETRDWFNLVLLGYAAFLAIFSLASLPIVWFVFTASRQNVAVFLPLYGIFWFGIWIFLQILTSPAGIFVAENLYVAFILFMLIGLIAAPLAISRLRGFRMVTTRPTAIATEEKPVDPFS